MSGNTGCRCSLALEWAVTLFPISKSREVGIDGSVQPGPLGLLGAQERGEVLHLLVEGFSIVLDLLCPDVSSGSQHVAVLMDKVQVSALAKPRLVLVGCRPLVSAPSMVSPGDGGHVLVRQFTLNAGHHAAHFAGIDEQCLSTTISESPIPFVPGQEPEADGNLGGVEELARQGHHAVHQVGLNDGLADIALSGLVGGHGTVGQHETCGARGSQMVEKVLDPCEVGVARRGHTVDPALVILQQLPPPIAIVEGRVGQDVIRLEVRLAVVVEGVAMGDLGIDPEFLFK